jgi:hypothetical protein
MKYTKRNIIHQNTTRKHKKYVRGGENRVIEYLKEVCLYINNENKTREELNELYHKLQTNIMKKSFPYKNNNFDDYFVKIRNEIENKLPTSNSQTPYEPKQWVVCKKTCYEIASEAISNEMSSTAYMLRVLSNSLISNNKADQKLYISYENKAEVGEPGNLLTGNWEYDSKYFTIKKIGRGNNKSSRLIMGFGPSASGKTYWARNIINLLNNNIESFPSTFFTIDGGDYRSLSYIYQIIIESAKKNGLGGVENLVLAGISVTSKNIFDSNIIKKQIIQYLSLSQIQDPTLFISLYVPETLGDCGAARPKSCTSKIDKYINVTNDKDWVGLMIYQHKTGEVCPHDLPYTCTGTTLSGKSRESIEGKKYSNSSFKHSMNQGLTELSAAPNLKFIIHNSGGKKYMNQLNKSIFMDMSQTSPFTTENINDIEQQYNCSYTKITEIPIWVM